jgi:hypothetical protein
MSSPRRTITRGSIKLNQLRALAESKRRNLSVSDGTIYVKEPRPGILGFLGFKRWKQSTASLMRRLGI